MNTERPQTPLHRASSRYPRRQKCTGCSWRQEKEKEISIKVLDPFKIHQLDYIKPVSELRCKFLITKRTVSKLLLKLTRRSKPSMVIV